VSPAIRSLALFVVIALQAPELRAQSVDPRLFDATLSPGAIIGLESAWIPAQLEGFVGIGVTYANDELVAATSEDKRVHRPLATRWITTLGLGLFDRLEVQLGASLHGSANTLVPGDDSRTFGVGDLRAALRVALLKPGRDGFELVAQVGAFFPTGGGVPFSGDGGLVLDPRLDPRLVLDWRSAGGFALAMHVGYRMRPERQVFDLTIGDELRCGLGLELPFGALGAAAPLSLGLSVLPNANSGPRLPPPDATLVAAPPASAPEFPKVIGSTAPTVLDEAMRSDPDIDGDGIAIPTDLCPLEVEDKDGHGDEDGCPDPADGGDGLLDAAGKCPTELEVPNGIANDDGCADERTTAVVVANCGVIGLDHAIEFESGSDVLEASSAPSLMQVASMWKANPVIKRLRIEGHTDNDGDTEMNVDLSERRVRQKIGELGVDGARIFPKGYGSRRAVASNATAAGRKKNRRAEFRIVDPWPEGVPPIDFDDVAPTPTKVTP